MKTKDIIELNGKQYNAVTGAIITTNTVSTATPKTTPITVTAGPKNVDGFFRAPRAAKPATSHAIKVVSVATQPSKKIKIHTPAQPVKAHTPQPAQTLMRTAVKKPTKSFKKQATIQGSLQHKVPSVLVQKQSASTVHPERLARAYQIERSQHISRFNNKPASIAVQVAPLAVQPAPPQQPPTTGAPAPTHTNKPIDIFEHAVANATNFVDTQTHRAYFRKKTRQHIASMAVGSLGLLVIAGFAAYQNTPGLQLKVASIQAGVSTGMPNFQASGFAYTGAKAQSDKLVVGFSGKSGEYQLTQQDTNWSSNDMIQNIGANDASGEPNYTTVKASNGTTVYRFSNDDATWVQNGKWYQVTGTGPLTDSQVTSLVKNS